MRETYQSEECSSRTNDVCGWGGGRGEGRRELRELEMVDANRAERMLTASAGWVGK